MAGQLQLSGGRILTDSGEDLTDELAALVAQQPGLTGAFAMYVGTHADPVSDAGTTRPTTPGPVYWICDNGITPTNAEDGDIIWNADA